MFDLVIQGGTVIDGTGGKRQALDVAVQGDRITRLAKPGALAAEPTRRTIAAAGLIVAPGFIDVHTHSDGWLLKIPYFIPKISQGFTTEILASDGISYAPVTSGNYRDWFFYLRSLNGLQQEDYRGWHSIAEYLGQLDRRNAQNVALEIPYANLRVLYHGWGRGPLDDIQLKLMRREVERGMEAGAIGLSTGLDYASQCFSSTEEIAEVSAAMAPTGGVYVTHVRYKRGTLRGVQEAVDIGRRAGVPVHISHLKGATTKDVEELLAYVDRVATREVDFSFDVYPYMPGSTMINYILPYEVWEDGPLAVCEKLRDPAVRERFGEILTGYASGMDEILLAWVAGKENSRYQGMSVADYAAHCGQSPADALCNLLIEENLAALSVLYRGDDRLIEPMLAHEKYMLGTDGIYFPDGVVHPRLYGSAARILGPLVRDRRLFSLEEAVRKVSNRAAERFRLKDRGVVREGAFADLAIFNPDTITDRATYKNPHQLSIGMEHVVVNGIPIWANGNTIEQPAGDLPGRVLRFDA